MKLSKHLFRFISEIQEDKVMKGAPTRNHPSRPEMSILWDITPTMLVARGRVDGDP